MYKSLNVHCSRGHPHKICNSMHACISPKCRQFTNLHDTKIYTFTIVVYWLIPDTKLKDWKSWGGYTCFFQLTAARKCVKHENPVVGARNQCTI